jgi:hypothetical protein
MKSRVWRTGRWGASRAPLLMALLVVPVAGHLRADTGTAHAGALTLILAKAMLFLAGSVVVGAMAAAPLYYVAYTTYLVIHAADHPALPAFRTAMLYYVLPLTTVTLLVVGTRALRGGAGRRGMAG